MKPLLPILATAVILSVGTRAKAQDEEQCVWVLDNSDPDFKQPPFEDSLTVLDHNGRIIKRTTEFNIAQTVGGHKLLSVSPNGLFALVADKVRKRLSRYSFPGTRDWSISENINAVAISRDRNAYALTTKGPIYGDQLLALNPKDGSILKRVDVAGFDIAVDDQHRKIWVVGADIQKLSRDELKPDFRLDPIQWCAVSVDYTSTGSAWVSEREHPQVSGSRNRTLKISAAGDIVKAIDFQEAPLCLAVNRANDTLWVAAGTSVYLFDSDGELLREIDSGDCWTIRVRQADQSVWVATLERKLIQLDHTGHELRSLSGFSDDQKYVATP